MAQGIFISYRREDSREIAATLYDGLKAAFPKKRIFLDVDMPEPGIEVIEKIARELESSQLVLAIIGPRWNATNRLEREDDFVRRELKHALVLKQKKKLRILPVLVHGGAIPKGALPADIAALEELEYLELAGEDTIAKAIERTRQLLPYYWVGSQADIVQWRWNWVELLKHLIALDIDEVPTIGAKPRTPLRRLQFEFGRLLEALKIRPKDPGDEGTPEQWALIFERHPQTWRLVLDREDNIVAYWHVAPLKPEYYKQFLDGRFKAGMVTYGKLTMFEKKAGIYNLFFVITVVDRDHRNAALYRQLFFSFFDVLDKLVNAEHPVFIAEVAADVWTEEGMKLAESFGMERIGQRTDDPNILIYSVSITSILDDYVARKEYPDLRERYMAAGFALDSASRDQRTHRIAG